MDILFSGSEYKLKTFPANANLTITGNEQYINSGLLFPKGAEQSGGNTGRLGRCRHWIECSSIRNDALLGTADTPRHCTNKLTSRHC
jgi:hypothetical protein